MPVALVTHADCVLHVNLKRNTGPGLIIKAADTAYSLENATGKMFLDEHQQDIALCF